MTQSGIDLRKLETRIERLGAAAKRSKEAAADDAAARNAALIEGEQAGMSLGELGRLAGMHPTSVQDVILRHYSEHPVTDGNQP